MADWIEKLLINNGLIVAFLAVAIITICSTWISIKVTNKKIPDSAIAIFIGLLLAYVSGKITKGSKGISDIQIFSGFGLLGGAMLRDFAIVSTAIGARYEEIKKAGVAGMISLLIGIAGSFTMGVVIALASGYHDPRTITTIGAGACTFIIGPVTGSALGVDSSIIALSIASGVVKSIFVTIVTPLVAKSIGLNNPQTAMIFGGLIGTTSGVSAGLAATDPALVPYGAMTATFYTGLGCLLCPSIFYYLVSVLA